MPGGGGRLSPERTLMTSSFPHLRRTAALLAALIAAAALAGCETINNGPPPSTTRSAPPPMTHTRAAAECWMATEKGRADMSLDKRADVVDKCIEQKMKGSSQPPPS
jgi:hypothetical protein